MAWFLAVVIAGASLMLVAGCTQDADGRAKAGAGKTGAAKGGAREHLVELAGVSMQTLRLTSVYTGSLRHRQTVRVFNQEEGRVTRLPYYEGDAVARGGVILELDDTLLAMEVRKARALRLEAQANVRRLKRLLDKSMASEDEYLHAVTALEVAKAEEEMLETRVGYTQVTAPFDSVVTERRVEPGDIVPRHTHVLTIADPSSLVTELGVSELLIPHIAVGDQVRVRIDALGDVTHSGQVVRIHPELDPRTRQGRVEVELRPVPPQAQSGQFARVSFTTEALIHKVMPFAALRRDREGEFVFRVDESKKARRVAVRSGKRQADLVEVFEGLEHGDHVVVRGFLGLTDSKAVTPVSEPADTAEGAAPAAPGSG
jgi:membrane fusion protein (multidrug efflux system)